MRARKPWVRARRKLLGWKVLFMAIIPLVKLTNKMLKKEAGYKWSTINSQ
jgi:hypothetical protein